MLGVVGIGDSFVPTGYSLGRTTLKSSLLGKMLSVRPNGLSKISPHLVTLNEMWYLIGPMVQFGWTFLTPKHSV